MALYGKVADAGGLPAVRFTYDYLGRRTVKEVWTYTGTVAAPALTTLRAKTYFAYLGWSLVAEYDGGTAIGALRRQFTWGEALSGGGDAGGLLAVRDLRAAHAGAYLAVSDGNGNVTALVDATTGLAAAEYEYDPFGNILRASGRYGAENPLRFAGEYFDRETGLSYYGLRYYSASLGRFINRDPIGESGGLNLYGFAHNDGINGGDLLGLAWWNSWSDFKSLWSRAWGSFKTHTSDAWTRVTTARGGRRTWPAKAQPKTEPLARTQTEDTIVLAPFVITAKESPKNESFFTPARGAGVMDAVSRLGIGLLSTLAQAGANLQTAEGVYNPSDMENVALATDAALRAAEDFATTLYGVSPDDPDRRMAGGATELIFIGVGAAGLVENIAIRIGSRSVAGSNVPRYILDENGLTTSAEGRITGSHTGRGKGYRPEPVGGRSPGDHRGHLIPEAGVDDPKLVNVRENIISEAPKSNLGPKKVIENFAIRLANQNPNSIVQMAIQPLRHPGQTRPYAVTVWVIQDGQAVRGVTVLNK